jgi:hypothetical protein
MEERIKKLKELVSINKSKKKLLDLELEKLEKELLDIRYPIMKWDDLESWLKENRPDNDFRENPIVMSLSFWKTSYCEIGEEGELIIGGYKHCDGFRRGEDIRVHYKFEKWR